MSSMLRPKDRAKALLAPWREGLDRHDKINWNELEKDVTIAIQEAMSVTPKEKKMMCSWCRQSFSYQSKQLYQYLLCLQCSDRMSAVTRMMMVAVDESGKPRFFKTYREMGAALDDLTISLAEIYYTRKAKP